MSEDDFLRAIQRYHDEHPVDKIQVPEDVSEDEAVRAVQEQIEQAGFSCPEEQALEIVRQARAGKQS